MKAFSTFQMNCARLVLIGCIITFASNVFARTIQVNQSGGGDYLTIQEGINAASEGDVVLVSPGVYRESVVINKKITLLGSGPEATAIYANTGSAVTFGRKSDGSSIIGFSITSDGEYGISCSASIGISNNVISGGRNGIYCSSDAAISNNIILGCGSDGVFSHSTSSTIINNIIADNGGYGVQNSISGIIFLPGSSPESPVVSYNDFWNNAKGERTGNFDIGPGNISKDPLFVNSVMDFRLRNGSPCIDAGKPGFASLDPDGTRNDMGAYGGPYALSTGILGPVITELEVSPLIVQQGGTITIKAKGKLR